MRLALLLACHLLVLPGFAQRFDSLAAQLHRQGFYTSSLNGVGPVSAVRLMPGGGVSFGPATLVYYFDRSGRLLPGSPYQAYSEDFERYKDYHHRAFAQKNERFGVINEAGQVVVPFLYQAIEPSYHPAGWLKVRQATGWGLVDSVGRVVVPPRYQQIKWFSDGMAAVQRDGRWGFLDLQGHERIPPTYRYVWESGFHEGFAAVSPLNDSLHVGFINKQNQSHTGFIYDYPFCVNRYNAHFRDLRRYYQFHHGHALVRNSRCEVGAIDSLGHVVLPVRFSSVSVTDSTLTGYHKKQKQVYRLPR